MKRMFNAIYPQVKEFLGRTGLTNNEIGWEWESGEENIFSLSTILFHFQGGPLDTMRNLDQFLPQDNSGKGEE